MKSTKIQHKKHSMKTGPTPKQDKWANPSFARARWAMGTRAPRKWRGFYSWDKPKSITERFHDLRDFIVRLFIHSNVVPPKKFLKKFAKTPTLAYYPTPVKRQLHVRMRRGTR